MQPRSGRIAGVYPRDRALRFGEACTKDDAVRSPFPRASSATTRQGPPMSGFSTARQKMVDGQVRPSDVTDSRIIDAMLAVPREAFVPPDQTRDGLSRPRSRCQRGRVRQALPDQARGDCARCCRPPRSRTPTRCWWSGCAPDTPQPWWQNLPDEVTATESDPALAGQGKGRAGRTRAWKCHGQGGGRGRRGSGERAL